MRAIGVIMILMIALNGLPSLAVAGWTQGSFISDGKPVEECHCVPSGAGPFPAVIILHGAGPKNMASDDFEDVCEKLAENGYYAEFLEYFSQTEAAGPGDTDVMVRSFSTWLSETRAGIASLRKNPAIGSSRIALMGFSLGAYISLVYGATYPDDVAAIIDYYGGLPPALALSAASMPPVLIFQGEIDRIVPAQHARELDAVLTKAGRPHQMVIYPGAQHGFNFPDALFWYKPEAAHDAFDRSLKFLDRYLKASASAR